MATATEVLAALAALAGESEATLGSNNTTVNKYFNAVGQPYCGYSLMYACKKAGSTVLDACANAAYVPTLKSYCAGKGWTISNNADAQPGDIFAYSNQHVGFVYAAYSGTTVITLEGNAAVYDTLAKAKASTAGSGEYEGIGFKKRVMSTAYTIYRPAYDSGSSASASSTGYAAYIRKFQTWINSTYRLGLAVDGVYGAKTKAGAIKALQTWLNKTYSFGLAVDGVYGAKTKAAMKKYPIKSGAKHNGVYILQGMLYCKGYDPSGFDGIFGSGTLTAVKKFQTAAEITADGDAGADTFTKLFE